MGGGPAWQRCRHVWHNGIISRSMGNAGVAAGGRLPYSVLSACCGGAQRRAQQSVAGVGVVQVIYPRVPARGSNSPPYVITTVVQRIIHTYIVMAYSSLSSAMGK